MIKSFLKYLFCVILLLQESTISILLAQSFPIEFYNLQTENGLPNNYINDICEDSLGFIWIGTTNGLCRYDSKEGFTLFNTKNNIIPELKSKNIRTLFADSKNQLWIGTTLGGLTKYNYEKDIWINYINDTQDSSSISNNEILSIEEDSKGRIWIGTENGLNLYNAETDNFYRWKAIENNHNCIPNNAVLDITEDKNGFIWVGTWDGGLSLILNSDSNNPATFSFRTFELSENLASTNVWKIFIENDTSIWVGTHGAGLFAIDVPNNASNNPNKQDWNINYLNFNKNNNHSISSPTFQDMLIDKNQNFWIGTANGLLLLNKENSYKSKRNYNFTNLNIDKPNTISLTDNMINKIFQSKNGIIWIGSQNGISQLSSQNKHIEINEIDQFKSIKDVCKNFVAKNNSIWFTTLSNDLYQIQNDFDKISKLSLHQFQDTKLYAICDGKENNLYIATNKGFVEYDIKTNSATEFLIPALSNKSNIEIIPRNIFISSDNVIYISTEYGLISFDMATKKSKLYVKRNADQYSISDNSINQVFEDSRNNIWVATFNGLNKIVRTENDSVIFKQFKNGVENNPVNLPSNQITALEEINNKLYIGTTSGITYLDLQTDHIPKAESLLSTDYVISIEKEKNNLWYSTINGIKCLNTETKSIGKYGKYDGIGDTTFKLMNSSKTKNGTIHFGSQFGIASINPKLSTKLLPAPKTYITAAKTISSKNEKQTNLINKDQLVLPHNNYYLELKYVGLCYERIGNTQFAYKLDGLDEDWFYTNKNISAVYTNLKAGDYTFKVKSANYQGNWTKTPAEIKIIKKPSILEMKWFQILGFILSAGLFWLIIKLYTRNIQRRNEDLNRFNKSLNEEIKERLKIEKDLLQSNQDLQQFAYSASHDLQEPLRNIGNAVGLLQKKNQFDKDSNEYVSIAVEGVKRMSSLIQNLLQYASTGSTDLIVEETDIKVLVKEKIKDLQTLITEKRAEINIKDLPIIYCESNQIGVVFYNLITNALKFNNKEKPIIEIGVSEKGTNNKIQFYVKDNGLGIPPEYQNRIFNMFTRLENKRDYEGTGIGLTLCQKIITKHNGMIWVSSIPNQGSTFFFTIDNNLRKNN